LSSIKGKHNLWKAAPRQTLNEGDVTTCHKVKVKRWKEGAKEHHKKTGLPKADRETDLDNFDMKADLEEIQKAAHYYCARCWRMIDCLS
jgi:hypothetical protein